ELTRNLAAAAPGSSSNHRNLNELRGDRRPAAYGQSYSGEGYMFERGDEQYLIRALNKNQVNLFLGAGFSLLAKNSLKEGLPSGGKLGQLIWRFLGYVDPYDPTTPLAELYENLLSSGKP